MVVKCVICVNDFETRIPNKRTCSKACRRVRDVQKQKDYQKRNEKIKTCEWCGEEFRDCRQSARFCGLKCVGSHNKKERYTKSCECCGKDILLIKDGYKDYRFCSRACFSKVVSKETAILNFQGKKQSPEHIRARIEARRNNGQPWNSEEAKKKMSETHRLMTGAASSRTGTLHSIETRAALSRAAILRLQNPENHPFYGKHHTEEAKKKMSDARLGVHPSRETRELQSLVMTNKYMSGNYYPHKRRWVALTEPPGKVFCRSSWEEKVLVFLDSDKSVLAFKYEPFAIVYHYEGIKKHYIPDILIVMRDGLKRLVEIKPSRFVEYPVNQAKFAAARQYCQERGYLFEIWTEREIKGLNL
jgi:hypothetical protein